MLNIKQEVGDTFSLRQGWPSKEMIWCVIWEKLVSQDDKNRFRVVHKNEYNWKLIALKILKIYRDIPKVLRHNFASQPKS